MEKEKEMQKRLNQLNKEFRETKKFKKPIKQIFGHYT